MIKSAADKLKNSTKRNNQGRPGSHVIDSLVWGIFKTQDNAIKTLGVTSCAPGAGVTTIACNLAVRLAEQGLGPVLLVDLNFLSPRLGRIFCKKTRAPGILDSLNNGTSVREHITPSQIAGLSVLPFGYDASQRGADVVPLGINTLIDELTPDYKAIIFDLPMLDDNPKAMYFASFMDGTVLVIEPGKVQTHLVAQLRKQMDNVGVNLVGSVMNKTQQDMPDLISRFL
ncbi:MAG: CpsD/CapB family tyrosine-protein kinase [Planctomycetales bacterium]|nr:CpsD/CapB family tyrosine-protein kinase [Planctomycetales bacterium]